MNLLSNQMEQLSETKSQIDNNIQQLKSRLQTMEEIENELRTEKRKLHREVSVIFILKCTKNFFLLHKKSNSASYLPLVLIDEKLREMGNICSSDFLL